MSEDKCKWIFNPRFLRALVLEEFEVGEAWFKSCGYNLQVLYAIYNLVSDPQ